MPLPLAASRRTALLPESGASRIEAPMSTTVASPINSTRRVLFASLIGTTIEFFDFYIYATAAVLVFPSLFFPSSDPATATLQSFATFALAFFARPVGSALFGHFGDRIGRKATLVAALLTMGLSTVLIGLLPTYASIGVTAPILLALCRFGQGLGLGGEWGGAVLLATENAPPGKRAWFGMFPQLGAPIGFVCANGIFLILAGVLDDAQFLSWGWRIPFVASAVLVFVGLWVRLRIQETPAFEQALARNERVRLPIAQVIARHPRALFAGTFSAMATFVTFYLMTVFTLSWGMSKLGYSREQFLQLQLIAVLFFAITIPISAVMADRYGRRRVLLIVSAMIMAFGLCFDPLFGSGTTFGVLAFLCLGMALMGLTYGPLGTTLAEIFPTAVRYTGASLSFNMAGIFGASLAPYIATWLAGKFGLEAVGLYLSGAALLTLLALLLLPRDTPEALRIDAR
jgi:metabolite-proton symporter